MAFSLYDATVANYLQILGAASAFLDALPNKIPVNLIPATGAHTTQLSFLTIGASDAMSRSFGCSAQAV